MAFIEKKQAADIFLIFGGCCVSVINTLNAELNSMCHFLPFLGPYHILHNSTIMVKSGNGMKWK
jgi:hypothetical protein